MLKGRRMPVSVSVGTEAQFDTKNGYIPTPTTPRSNPTHRKMAGHVCEMALARAISACLSLAPRISLLALHSFLFLLSSRRGIVMGPIRELVAIFHRFLIVGWGISSWSMIFNRELIRIFIIYNF